MNSRRYLALIILAVTLSLLAPGGARAADSVKFALSWVPTGRDAGFYAALERGDYRAEGLEVTILRGNGSGDTVKRVAVGTEEFGFADATNVVLGRARGLKVRLVGMIHDKSLFGVYSLKSAGIGKPQDLAGKRIGSPAKSATRTVFPAFAGLNGVDLPKIEWVDMTNAAMVPSLLAGRVDAILIFANEFPSLRQAAAKQGREAGGLLFSDYGVDVYSNGLIASDETLQKRPELVRRFVRATMKGVAWAAEHPEDAARMFVKHNPANDEQLAVEYWKIAVEHLVTPATRASGLGVMSKDKVQATRDLITKYEKVAVAVPVEELYTNDFLPRLMPK